MTHPWARIQIKVKVVPKCCIADSDLCLYQYTAIDEDGRLRYIVGYSDQSTYSSADFLKKMIRYARHGIKVECVQADNGFEFTNRFANSNRNLPSLFEKNAAELGIWHKLMQPYT